MDIGSKLKNSRKNAGLTQEAVAEKIGISRQTLSNWENNKSYPDVVSVIHLSDLYSVSLDELLKEDAGMMKHIEETTNDVKSRQKFSKLVQVIAYLVIWAVAITVFWLGGRVDAMGYSLVVLWLVLPVSTFIISIFIGKDDDWANYKWLMLIFFGVMYMLAEFATFKLANAVAFHKTNLPEITSMLPGMLCSAAGMLVGTVVRNFSDKNKKRLLQHKNE